MLDKEIRFTLRQVTASPWFSLTAAAIVSAAFFGVVYASWDTNSVAAWVQAVGSVVAILVAVWVSHDQHERDAKRLVDLDKESNYMRTRRLRAFIEHLRAYIEHYGKMGFATRPSEKPYHEQQMASFQALYSQLLLDEDDLDRQSILSELSHHLFSIQGNYIPGRQGSTKVDEQLAALALRLSTTAH